MCVVRGVVVGWGGGGGGRVTIIKKKIECHLLFRKVWVKTVVSDFSFII